MQLATPHGAMSAVWQRADNPCASLVLAHGAGAGFDHAHMAALADAFTRAGLSCLRFNFPFAERGVRRVDAKAVCLEVLRAAAGWLVDEFRSDAPIYLGGHSFGGRMASHLMAQQPALSIEGLVYCSFPLHAANKPSVERAKHLPSIALPQLFLSGTRDALADPELLSGVVAPLPEARIHWLDTADHSFKVRKRSRTVELDVYTEAALAVHEFVSA